MALSSILYPLAVDRGCVSTISRCGSLRIESSIFGGLPIRGTVRKSESSALRLLESSLPNACCVKSSLHLLCKHFQKVWKKEISVKYSDGGEQRKCY